MIDHLEFAVHPEGVLSFSKKLSQLRRIRKVNLFLGLV